VVLDIYIYYNNVVEKAAYSYVWDDKADEILPEHYKKRCLEFMTREPTPVHYVPSSGTFGIHKLTKLP
jgi:hypothetical protein